MKSITTKNVFVIILGFIAITFLAYSTPKTKVVIPKNATSSIAINVSGKNLKYYPILTDEATILSVRGPGKLKIITRAYLSSNSNNSINYFVYYRINGGQKLKVDFSSADPDTKAYFENSSFGFPSIGENIIVELARGDNTIEVWNGTKKNKVCIRSLFTQVKEKKIDWVKISPVYPNEPVSLATNEEVVSYFRYSSSNPLKIKITGPTTLRILNRVEFDYKMKGKISYRVEVRENKKLVNTYMLCSDRSDVTKYKNDGKKTPGKANEIVINVPSGTHLYKLSTLDHYTVLARILFHKKDIILEEN